VTAGLGSPLGIIVDAPVPGFILVADRNKNQIVCLSDDNSSSNNNSVVASNWTGGDQLLQPMDIFLDITRGNNLYVSDSGNNRVVMFAAMQSVAPPPKIIAGIGGCGSAANQFNGTRGISIDRQGNAIIADYDNHRIMLYAPNATSGTMIAGLGIAGSDSLSLHNPTNLFLDELNSWLYVVDMYNHRIQRFLLNTSSPLNGTTVAGGNGPGPDSDQLNTPLGIWVSNKTGAIYIADGFNNRIQRWDQGATSGVTIAGDLYGGSGTNAIMLQTPYRLYANTNETLLYVSDTNNGRVQRFELI
jgi:hypothetical protein